MNILLISDDGPESIGLEVLKEAAKSFWPSGKIITITPHEHMAGKSMSITPTMGNVDGSPHVSFKNQSPFHYVVKGTPVDCLYLGMLYPTEVLGTDRFDVVLTGVNQGANVGVDVFHSGTVAVAMLASTLFGVPSIAFSQQVPKADEGRFTALNERATFGVAEQFTRKVLANHSFAPGVCLNVNFPERAPKGYKNTSPAPYSRWLPSIHSTDSNNDIIALGDGFITVSELELSVTSNLRY